MASATLPSMTAAPDYAIQTRGLSKRYGQVAALTDLSLSVPDGSIYGFLGPNGAGKTTMIRMLLGFIRPSAGEARVLGHDSWRDGVAARVDSATSWQARRSIRT
jgi:ABC-2 type transport system ATP-binding protein